MAYRVLIADSSPSVLKTMHLAFQNSHYALYTTGDGGEVMGLLPQVKPDAIVLGLSLPRIDGYELARQLRKMKEFERIPLILLQAAFEEAGPGRGPQLRIDAGWTSPRIRS